MKNIYKTTILTVVLLTVYFISTSYMSTEVNTTSMILKESKHKNTSSELIAQRKQAASFPQYELFSYNEGNNSSAKQFASDAVMLKLDQKLLGSLNSLSPNDIALKFPKSASEFIELELTKVDIFDSKFKLTEITRNGNIDINYKGGIYYTGIIKGNDNSIATLSVFDNSVMAIISTDNGNFVLGSVKTGKKELTNEYIFYNDINMNSKPQFECKAGDTYNKFYRDSKNNEIRSNSRMTTSPVKMFYVCDYQMYLDNGSNVNSTMNYVSGAFLHVQRLYSNENITLNISDIAVYDFPDPYRTYSTSQTIEILQDFGTKTADSFNGDLAQLLSSRTPVMGGVAWINVLCQSYDPAYQSGRYSFCQIENTYSPYPVFSWTITVMTHEAGHNFGSDHTQACVWPVFSGGGLGAIDSCVAAEHGSCFSFTQQNNNGTIMSYCHLNGNINFLRGFGPLPGDTIRFRYNQALCLDSNNFSSEPLVFSLLQNYPNPFNPGTYIKYALPEDGFVTIKVFDITGKEVTQLVNHKFYNAGVFSTYFDASLYNLSSGVYLYRISVTNGGINKYSEIKKMVLVK